MRRKPAARLARVPELIVGLLATIGRILSGCSLSRFARLPQRDLAWVHVCGVRGRLELLPHFSRPFSPPTVRLARRSPRARLAAPPRPRDCSLPRRGRGAQPSRARVDSLPERFDLKVSNFCCVRPTPVTRRRAAAHVATGCFASHVPAVLGGRR